MHRQHQRPARLSVDDLHLDPNSLATLLLVLRFLQQGVVVEDGVLRLREAQVARAIEADYEAHLAALGARQRETIARRLAFRVVGYGSRVS